MGVDELHMTPVLYLYKLLGGLPYTWKYVNKEFRKADDDAPLGEMQRHHGWFIWAVIIGVSRLGYSIYAAKSVSKVFDDCANTVVVITAVEDVFSLLSTLLLGFHVIRRSESLASSLAALQSICRKYGFEAKPYYSDKKFLAVMTHLVLGFSFITYGNAGMAAETEWSPEHKAAIFEASINPLILSLAMFMYARILDLQGLAYLDFLKILNGEPEEEDAIEDVWAATVKLPPGVKPDVEKKKPRRDPLQNFNAYKAKNFILDLYDCIGKAKDYFAFMVGITLLHSMISSIVKCFVAVIGKDPTSSYYVATIGSLIITLFPVFFITNSPRALNNSVRQTNICPFALLNNLFCLSA